MAVHLVTGADDSLVIGAVGELVRRLVGDGDRSLMVDDFDGEEYELRAVVDAAQTPPFLTDSRIVVARGVNRFTDEQLGPLIAYLDDPLASTHLVLVTGGGRLLGALDKAVKRSGAEVIATAAPQRGRERATWFEEQIEASGLRLDRKAVELLGSWLGEDAGRLEGILDTLRGTYGNEHVLKADDVQPFLGEAGGVPPWDLTDAIDRGDTTAALELLHRMMRAGERHALAVMAILHGQYSKLLTLDGADERDDRAAAELLGIKPGYPAKKLLDQYRRLGSGPVLRAMQLLAQADLDLRGAKDWPDELVMEVLVARLSRLSSRR